MFRISGMWNRLNKSRLLVHAFLLLFSLALLFPVLWTFVLSFRSLESITSNPVCPLPNTFLKNYIRVLNERPFLLYIRNSLLVTVPTVLVVIALGSLGAYCLNRFHFRLNKAVFVLIIATRLFPPISLLVPWYALAERLNILDTRFVLVLIGVYLNLPISIWLLRGFFDDFPREFDEAGLIDGCTRISVFFRIVAPIIAPAIAAVAIMTFLSSWNDFLLPAIVSFSDRSRTLPVGVVEFIADEFIEWNLLSAGAIITSLPALFFVMLFQKYIVAGLSAGGIKG